MATIDEIKQQAAAVKNATQVGENTAERVGGALAGLADIADKVSIKDEEGALVETPFRYIQNEEYIFAKVDAEEKLLFGIHWDGTPEFGKTSAVEDRLHSQVTHLAEKIATIMGDEDTTSVIDTINELKKFFAKIENTETLTSILANLDKTTIKDEEGNVQDTPFRVIESPEYLALETDEEDKVLAATYPDGSHYAHNMRSETIDALENKVSKINDDTKSLNDNVQNISQKIETISRVDVYSRNANNIPLLQSACRYNNGKKDFLMCIIADSHSEEQAVQNAVALTNKIDVIDAIIHCGDITATRFDKTQILNFYNDYKHCEKPWLVVIGNHDVGNTMYLQYSATHEEIFQYYIKPMIDGGILNNGEYQEGKPYYFHDFTDRKIRVIVPYEYDNPLDVADNEYWNSIDYDGSLPQLVPGKTYSVGDKVNSGGYKDNSFICKKEVVTINNQYDNNYTIPYYKSGRAARVIRKEQAEWLVNTLKSTPDEYGVIIATHNPAMLNSTNQINSKFAVDTAYKGVTQGQYAIETDLISEIVNAFIKKIQLSLKVVMKSANWYKADASYMNILGDTGEKYAYQIEADFSHIQNCYFACYVGGHSHKDLVFKHDTYESQYGINPVCASTNSENRGQADIVNINVDSLNYDALTCISVSKGRIALSRLGNQLSINGKHRDIEIINI
jgi:predicted phosphodiesterase